MIQVVIRRDEFNYIQSFSIDGHANYQPGHDIVCAAVSAIAIGTVNSLDMLAHVKMPTLQHRSGWLKVAIDADPDQRERAQVILESMVIMLWSIVQAYGNHVKIIDKRGGAPVAHKPELPNAGSTMATEM